MLIMGVTSEFGGKISATSSRKTTMARKFVIIKEILSPQSGGRKNATRVKAATKDSIINN